MKIVSTLEHYDSLAHEGHDPVYDPPLLREYMSGWDGAAFFDVLDSGNKDVLEVGVGTGRVAIQVLQAGCRKLTGLDLSPKTINLAAANLRNHPNVELGSGDITDFLRPGAFDLAYSVLTFLHIADKAKALSNIYHSLKPDGRFVLSASYDEEWLVYGERKLALYPLSVSDYIRLFETAGFQVESVRETERKLASILVGIKKGSQ